MNERDSILHFLLFAFVTSILPLVYIDDLGFVVGLSPSLEAIYLSASQTVRAADIAH